MNTQIFREYDIRGLVDKDLTEDVVDKLGRGLGTMLVREGGRSIVVGRDCRESSTRFRDALCRGLTSTGLSVLDIGVVPTPLTYFGANTLPGQGQLHVRGSAADELVQRRLGASAQAPAQFSIICHAHAVAPAAEVLGLGTE
jgi:phosphomannomutase/phosphoglucomutase